MNLTEKSKKRVIDYYREVEGINIPTRLVFDPEYSPSEKLAMSIIFQLAWINANRHPGEYWTDFTNGEFDRILGGVSLRSLHRHFVKFRNKGLIAVTISNTPRLNYRKIHLTRKGIKYFFDIDVGESITVVNDSGTMTL